VRLTALGALAVGYVLGTKAGRERYEEIRQLAGRAAVKLEIYGSSGSLATRVAEIDRHRPRAHGEGRLSEGILVETHLLARVLGVRLLRVDGVVTVAPARVAPSPMDPRAVPMTSTVELGAGLERAAHLLRACERRPPTSTR